MKKITKIIGKYAIDWFSDKDLLQLFPHAREIIPEKISDYEQLRNQLEKNIGKLINQVNKATNDEFTRWFAKKLIAMEHITTLINYDKHIMRLKRQQRLFYPSAKNSYTSYDSNFQEKIEYVKNIPIQQIVGQYIELKQAGKDYIGICPFHADKHPSMRCYTDGNNFYCFGCNKWGSTIDFVMEMQGITFKDAVNYLYEHN